MYHFFSYVSVNKWQFEKLSKQTNDPCYQQASAGTHQKTKKKQRMKMTSASDTNVYFIKMLLCVFLRMGCILSPTGVISDHNPWSFTGPRQWEWGLFLQTYTHLLDFQVFF